jgi:hypothetical protein
MQEDKIKSSNVNLKYPFQTDTKPLEYNEWKGFEPTKVPRLFMLDVDDIQSLR